MMLHLVFVLALALSSVNCGDSAVEPTTQKAKVLLRQGDVKLRSNLLKSLMENYEHGINPDEPNVKFGISLLTVKIIEHASTLDSNVWLRMSWHDSRLAWDTSVFPIDALRVEFSNLWHPDVTLFNSADIFSTSTSCVETNAIIYANGDVLWVPPCHLNSMCETTLKTHPYERQVCTLKFGSWTYDSNIMDIDFYANETAIDTQELKDLTEWRVLSTTAVKNNKVYPCCAEPYADLTFNLTLQRKPESVGDCPPSRS